MASAGGSWPSASPSASHSPANTCNCSHFAVAAKSVAGGFASTANPIFDLAASTVCGVRVNSIIRTACASDEAFGSIDSPGPPRTFLISIPISRMYARSASRSWELAPLYSRRKSSSCSGESIGPEGIAEPTSCVSDGILVSSVVIVSAAPVGIAVAFGIAIVDAD